MSTPNKLRTLFARHKYKAGIFILLVFASMVCVVLVAARAVYGNSGRYVWLVWNLFLAWIPFVLAYLAYILSWRKWLLYIAIPIFAFLWLVFFPNAPYILTDLQHLNRTETPNIPLWYDVILLTWFSWTGMLLGVVSLNLMQEIVRRRFGRWPGWIFVLIVAGLTGAGIYIGRFIELNSWDIFQNPATIARDLWAWLQDPSLRSVGFISLYTLFFLFAYIAIHIFGRLIHEGAEKSA